MNELRCLLDTASLCLFHDAATGCLYCQWLGPHNAASVGQQAEAIFACLAANPCCKLLSDHSQRLGNWRAAAPSVVRRNFERLADYGIAYVAWVPSFDYNDQLAMEQVMAYVACPTVALCNDVASAYEWLTHYPCSHPAAKEQIAH